MSKHHAKTKKLIFGRSLIFMGLLGFQLLLFLFVFFLFAKYVEYLYGFFITLSTILVIHIVSHKQNPAFKLAWIIPMQAIPIFGALLFFFVRLQPGSRKMAKKLEKIELETSNLCDQDYNLLDRLRLEHRSASGIAKYNKDSCGLPICTADSLQYFREGEDMWKQLLEDLSSAKVFIFMEYFIVETGQMWDAIEEILSERAAAGVEVRFLYDGIGSISTVDEHFPQYLRRRSIDCKIFAKAKPLLSTAQNNRDHRKITVIDGKIAYTGGLNLADEYINVKTKYGHWKDTALRMEGEVVNSFTTLFLQLWHCDEDQPLYWPYLLQTSPKDPNASHSNGFVMAYGDNPFDDQTIARNLYMDILYNAKDYVHIMSPYLILDNEMIVALQYAASRGVEVILLLPHIPDKAYAYLLARSYYEELLDKGVSIYEYSPGFIHAKVFVSDDSQGVVGTSNLDYRSLYLHFECGAYIVNHPVLSDIETDFQSTLALSQLITKHDCKKLSFTKKIIGKALRLVAPLM